MSICFRETEAEGGIDNEENMDGAPDGSDADEPYGLWRRRG